MRNKLNFQTSCLHSSLFPRFKLIPIFSPFSPPVTQGDREWGLYQFIALCLSFVFRGRTPWSLPLLQCWAAAVGDSPPLASPAWHRLQGMNSSSVDPFPWSAILQEQVAPVLMPHRVTSAASKSAPVWPPLFMGPQVLLGACSSRGLPQSQPPSGTHQLHWGVLHGLQVDACSPMSFIWALGAQLPLHGLQGDLCSPVCLPGLQRHSCLTMGCTNGCRGISAPAPKAPPALPTTLTLGLQGCSHLFSLFSPSPAAIVQWFSPSFFNGVFPEALPPSLVGCPLASAYPSWTSCHGLYHTGGKLLAATQRSRVLLFRTTKP